MTTQTVHDPVCHMDITQSNAAGFSSYEGQTYYFCARGCKMDFDEDPAGILQAERTYDHSQPMAHGMSPEKEATKPWWRFWG